MDKIYVIVSGQYSDWCLEGYSTDREEAELICYHHNQLPESYDDWYVMPLDKIEHEIGNHSIYWNYSIRLEYTEDGYKIDDYHEETYVKANKEAVIPSVEKCETKWNKWHYVEWSNTRFLSWEEAKKIASDMLAQQLAAELLG